MNLNPVNTCLDPPKVAQVEVFSEGATLHCGPLSETLELTQEFLKLRSPSLYFSPKKQVAEEGRMCFKVSVHAGSNISTRPLV